uniref:Uncharacterized protein n=1 Tax=Sus scrofa TaxID=9823 RepID=A0A8D1Z6A2_PIG
MWASGSFTWGWSQPTSFDCGRWRHTHIPASMMSIPQESRISVPSVASLSEELLQLDQGARRSGTWRGASVALPPHPPPSPLLPLPCTLHPQTLHSV